MQNGDETGGAHTYMSVHMARQQLEGSSAGPLKEDQSRHGGGPR